MCLHTTTGPCQSKFYNTLDTALNSMWQHNHSCENAKFEKENIIATVLLQIQLQTQAINTFLHYFSFREKLFLICESVFCILFRYVVANMEKSLKICFFSQFAHFLNVLIFSLFAKTFIGPFFT